MMNEREKTKLKVYLVRKSWVDESTELARCSEYDLAVAICKPGYSIFDEKGTLMYTAHSSNRFNHGDIWNRLKLQIERDLIKYDSRRIPFITRKELRSILYTLFTVLRLMNEVEVEDDREI